jgi:hypothetical protein
MASVFHAFFYPLLKYYFSFAFLPYYLLSDSEMLRYAYAEVEESRGEIQVLIVSHLFHMLHSLVLGL